MRRTSDKWLIHGETVIELYNKGLTAPLIAERVGLSKGSVYSFLCRNGLLRSASESRKLAWKLGRMNTTIKTERDCEHCHELYVPASASQKLCFVCAPNKKFRSLVRAYGITKIVWDTMLAEQLGSCKLCPRPPQYVDHCHKTGRVRGLLCPACNTALGRVESSSDWVDRALKYLENR